MIEPNFLVEVRCLTFNHSKYITDAMNGFCMQQTNFPFVCCIIDDASTDGEQEIINNYLQENFELSEESGAIRKETEDAFITFACHKKNNNCYFAVYYLKENHYSKKKSKNPYWDEYGKDCSYIAYCEGDDNWIAPLKLQKQVDCLEKDKTFSCCFSSVRWVDKSGIKLAGTFPPKQTSFCLGTITLEVFLKEDFAKGKWSIQLSGFMVRAVVDKTFRRMLRGPLKKYPFGDYPLFITAFLLGNCYFIGEEMSCYRVMSGGYNSQMQANISKAVENQNKIKAAMVDIDNYTKGKYHSCFQKNMLWCDLNIFYMKNKKVSKLRNLLELLKPHYWSLLPYSILSKLRK